MKISKKIIGVALALIMIFNVFAVGTFAAFPDDTLVKLMISTDKATYAPGDEVVLTISEQCLPELGTMMIGGQYEIAYNDKVVEPFATTNVITDHGFEAIQAGSNTNYSGVAMPAGSSGPSALYDWNSTISYNVLDDGVTTFDATSAVDLFTIKMKIKADAADGTYTIGFNPQGYEDYAGFSNDGIGLGGLYGPSASDYGFSVPNMYEYGTVTFKVSSAPAVEVKHVAQQSKWKGGNANNTAENYLFGFVGQFTGIDVETKAETVNGVERQQVQNIKSIVATATINGQTVTSNVITIWAVDGGYQFRAQFAGFTPDSTLSAAVTFAVTMSDGTTVYTSAEASRVINDIYTASVANGLPAVAA